MRGVTTVPWTDEERKQLRQLHANGLTQGQMAAMLGRSKHSIHRQCLYLGLKSGHNSPIKPMPPGSGPGGPITTTRHVHRAPRSTLPPLPSLAMRGDGECEPC